MGNTELQIKLEPLTDHEIKHSKDLFLSSYHTFDLKPSGSCLRAILNSACFRNGLLCSR